MRGALGLKPNGHEIRYLTVKESIFDPLDPIAVSLITFVPALRETGAEEMLQLVQVPVDGKES